MKKLENTLQEAIEWGIKQQAVAIVKKGNDYQTAKNRDELKYAESLGWTYVGHPMDLK